MIGIGEIVEISTDDGPAEAVVTRVWDKPASDPYITVRTTEDQGRTFVRCASTVKVVRAMFDMLTADELYRLHTSLYDQGTRVHRRMIGPDGNARMSVFGADWAILSAWHAQISEMQFAVGDELRRRAWEARADA